MNELSRFYRYFSLLRKHNRYFWASILETRIPANKSRTDTVRDFLFDTNSERACLTACYFPPLQQNEALL